MTKKQATMKKQIGNKPESLYAELKQAGVPIANHESDLYFPVTAETRAILDRWPEKATATTFLNQVEGGLWFDVPFAFIPWWEAKRLRRQK